MSKNKKNHKQANSAQSQQNTSDQAMRPDQSQPISDDALIDSDALFEKWALEDAQHSQPEIVEPRRFSVAHHPLALVAIILVACYLAVQSYPAFKAVLEADQYDDCGDVSLRPKLKDTNPNAVIQFKHQQKCKLKGIAQGMNLYAVGKSENPESKDPFESKKGIYYVVKLVGDRVFAMIPAHEVWVEGYRLKTDSLLGLEIDAKGMMVSPKKDRMYEKLGQQLRESFQISENEEIFFFDTAYHPWQNKILIFTFIFSPIIILLALFALYRLLKTQKLEKELQMLQAKSQVSFLLILSFFAFNTLGLMTPKTTFAQSQTIDLTSAATSAKANDLDLLKIEKPFIWTVKHPKTPSQTSYLIGTIHIPHPFFQPIPQVFKSVLDQCSAFYAELDITDKQSMAMQMMNKAMMTNGDTLSSLLTPHHKTLLDQYLQAKNIPSFAFETMHPGFVEIMLLAFELQAELSKGSALDEILINEVKSKGKPTGGIETIDEQINVLLSDSPKVAAASLGASLEKLKAEKAKGINSIHELVKAYFSGDPKKVDAVSQKEIQSASAHQKHKFKKMLDDRNLIMFQRIIKHLEQDPKGSNCFAFGTAHFVSGKNNIIDLLRKKGYQITQQ